MKINFSTETLNYSHGQTDMRTAATIDKEMVGYVDYSVYENRPNIKYIFVKPEFRRSGIATQLMQAVQKEHPDQEVSLGMSTPMGTPFVKSLNRTFTKNPDFKSIHLQLKNAKKREAELQQQYDDFDENPTEEKRQKLLALGDEYNDLSDKIRSLQKDAQEIKAGKWMINTGFKEWLTLFENFTIQKYAAKGDGYYFGLKIGRKRVGHVGGIEKDTHERDENNQLVPVHYFDVMNVQLDDDQRGKGWFQPALQQIADMFSNGIKSAKVQTSAAFAKAMRKMPTYREDENNHMVLSNVKAKSAMV